MRRLNLLKKATSLSPPLRLGALKVGQFFMDDYGKSSAMRLTTFAAVALILGVWGYCCLINKTYIEIGAGEASIVIAAIGGKAVESAFEYRPHERLAHSKGLIGPKDESDLAPSIRGEDE